MSGSIVITGATGGLTSVMVKNIHKSRPDEHLVLLVRNPAKVKAGLLPPESDTITYITCDQCSLDSVRKAMSEIKGKIQAGTIPRIKALVESAAIQVTSPDQPRVTKDGYEETVAVNHLSHFVMIMELLPFIQPDGKIIIVGSDSHQPNYPFFPIGPEYDRVDKLVNVEAASEPSSKAKEIGWGRYATSKLLQMMIGHELARRLKSSSRYSGIHVALFDPGSMGTGLLRDRPWMERTLGGFALEHMPSVLNWLSPAIHATTVSSSATQLAKLIDGDDLVAAQPVDEKGQVVKEGGAPYYDPWGKQTFTQGEANEADKCKELWDDSAKLLGYDASQATLA